MRITLIFIALSAAFFCGWALGPAATPLARKFKKWDAANRERSAALAKQYSIQGVWFTHPDIWDNMGSIFSTIIGIVAILWLWFKGYL